MTKQQLLALLREAFNFSERNMINYENGYDTVTVNEFIAEVEHTNRVGDLELPDINKLKADAVREAVEQCLPVMSGAPDDLSEGMQGYCEALHSIDEYANKLERGDL